MSHCDEGNGETPLTCFLTVLFVVLFLLVLGWV